jgi:hypothetical protein
MDALAQALADLALDIAESEDADPAAGAARADELRKQVRNALRKKHDEVLYGAIEVARYTDADACRYLRSQVEEAAATLQIRREGAPALEIDAFLLPLFVQSSGGLRELEGFQDDAAFEQLVASFGAAGLESPGAQVVLIRHAYDLDEIDRITYSQLHDMLREAASSMTNRKLAPTPALEHSIHGWSGTAFQAHDAAMELRFLLGFSLKRADDPFYQVPADESEADDYFAARMERYRQWTVSAAPLVQRCLAARPARLGIDFLYQDLFFGAKEQGVAELAMLRLLADLNQALEERQLAPGQVQAVVAPLDGGETIVLRVHLYRREGGATLASVEKTVDPAADLAAEVDELCDALLTLGVGGVAVARGFGADGQPEQADAYRPA